MKNNYEIKYYDEIELEELYKEELIKNEAINQLVIGNIIYTKESKAKGIELDPNNSFGVILKNDEPLYFMCNFLPYNMIVTSNGDISKEDEEICVKLLAKSLIDKNIEINGIQSPVSFSDAFVNEYPGDFKFDKSSIFFTPSSPNICK